MTFLKALVLVGLGAASVAAQSPLYGQCGGIGWSGATTCVSGSVCTYSNPYYSQCLPGTASSTTSTKPTTTSSGAPSSTPTVAKLQFAGINIAGFDFGCGTDGTCNLSQTAPPLSQYGATDGAGQMQHFVNDDGFNIFRLPVAWQFLINNQNTAGSTLDSGNFAKYDSLVQACLATGAHCIIDIHNYARFNGAIVGQGGPANSVLATLWGNIAAKYASQSNVVFGVMNEPHDIPNISTWATTVQAAVTAIRQAGATSQIILLPGNDYTSAQQFVSDGSGPALLGVKNPDGTTTNLIFDVHKYLDSDNSGTHTDCVTNNIQSAWEPLATWLRQNGRQALNSETGGGNVQDCVTNLCQQIAYQAQNSDVFLGYIGWSAGAFATSEVPTHNGNTWQDTLLVSSCLSPNSGSQSGSTGQ
ncbi:endoglucanase [Gymnopilus junonius]|uniref:cellulase n=1 Tax=Gymnopilus junonius TaxID=109634 RepID=A0A9P5NXI1_GYMJU|nr:endoglucanase [Gymnopilus junonius]